MTFSIIKVRFLQCFILWFLPQNRPIKLFELVRFKQVRSSVASITTARWVQDQSWRSSSYFRASLSAFPRRRVLIDFVSRAPIVVSPSSLFLFPQNLQQNSVEGTGELCVWIPRYCILIRDGIFGFQSSKQTRSRKTGSFFCFCSIKMVGGPPGVCRLLELKQLCW